VFRTSALINVILYMCHQVNEYLDEEGVKKHEMVDGLETRKWGTKL
jgi:hypothetical protein